MRFPAQTRAKPVSKPATSVALDALALAADKRPPLPNAPRQPRPELHLPTLFPLDPVAPSVTEALNSLRIQIQAGVPLGKSLRTCAKQCRPPRAKHAFVKAASQVEDGASFDDMLQTLSACLSFPERAILSAGWAAGKIEPAIKSVVTRREVMYKTRREVRSKLIFPAIQFVMASFIASAVPYLAGMFTGHGMSGTQYLINALTPIVIVAALFITVRAMQHAATRQYSSRGLEGPPPPPMPWDYPMLKIPVLAMVQKWRNRGDFASLMGDLLAAGLTTLNALQICSKALPNGVYRNQLLACRKRVEMEGISIAEALPPGELWPEDWLTSLEIAHTSGEEEATFKRLGEQARERYLDAIRAAGNWTGKLFYFAVGAFIIFKILPMLQQIGGFYSSF